MRKHYIFAGIIFILLFQLYLLYSYYFHGKNSTAYLVELQSINSTGKIPEKDETNELYSCYHKYNLEPEFNYLEDLCESKKQPTMDKTIFFIVTTCFRNNSIGLAKR